MIGIPSMDNYIIQYEGKRWKEKGLMTKRHPMAGHDPSSWSFGVKKEIFSSLGQKERLRDPKETLIKSDNDLIRVSLKGKHGDPHRSDLTPLFTCLRENHLRGRLSPGNPYWHISA